MDACRRRKNRFRSLWWRWLIPDAPSDFNIAGKIECDRPCNVRVGHGVVWNEGVYINARGSVVMGDRVHLSPYVRINTGALDLDQPGRVHKTQPVRIGNDVWIATGVIINPGVTIHDGVVVGAGAVVTRDLPPFTLCVGVPAKPIRDLPELPQAPNGPHQEIPHSPAS